MFIRLMTTRRFAPLFWCQFISAFNSNFLKNSLAFLVLFTPSITDPGPLFYLIGAAFIAPFFLLSGLGGETADRFDKAIVTRWVKLAEIVVGAVAVIGYWFQSIPVLVAALFTFGVLATLFGPIKYGILPDHLSSEELPSGNALVAGATFLAILLATIGGGLVARKGDDPAVFGAGLMLFAVLGWASSMLIPRTGAGAPQLRIDPNVARSTGALIKMLWSDPRLGWGALVIGWFWLVSAMALSLMPRLVTTVLGGNEQAVIIFLAIFSISVAIGSGLAAWLSHGQIVHFPILVGAFIIGVCSLDLGWATYGATSEVDAVFTSAIGVRVAVDFAGLAIGGGLLIVPTFSAVQAWAAPDRRARVVAAVNVVIATLILAGTLVVAELQTEVTTPTVFMLIAGADFIVLGLIAYTMPTNLARDGSHPLQQPYGQA